MPSDDDNDDSLEDQVQRLTDELAALTQAYKASQAYRHAAEAKLIEFAPKLAEAQATIAKVREHATEWASLAPADDWGDTPMQTVTADVGRAVLYLLDGPSDG